MKLGGEKKKERSGRKKWRYKGKKRDVSQNNQRQTKRALRGLQHETFSKGVKRRPGEGGRRTFGATIIRSLFRRVHSQLRSSENGHVR